MSYCLFSLDLYQRDAGLALVPTSWCEDLSVFLKSCKGRKNALVILCRSDMGVVENQERSCLRQQDCADPYDGDPQGSVDAQAVEPSPLVRQKEKAAS